MEPGGTVDQARYFIAVLVIVTLPPSIGWWYVIHPFAGFWRRLGSVVTFTVLTALTVVAGLALWAVRGALLGADLGAQPLLLALAVVAAAAGIAVARQRRRVLTSRILIGVPEISGKDKGRLLTEGVYATSRNPRYLELLAFVLAYVAFANYVGTWMLYVLSLPAIHVVVLLEERELRDRFGAEYDEYCRRVPRYIRRL
jgi:protein-S-isoprenylcysteine O-methyltransferase Ste14